MHYHGGYTVNRDVRYGPYNMADDEPGKNKNNQCGMMMQVRGNFRIGIDSLDCGGYSWGVSVDAILFSCTTPG